MSNKGDYAIQDRLKWHNNVWMTLVECRIYSKAFCLPALPCAVCSEMIFRKPKHKFVEPVFKLSSAIHHLSDKLWLLPLSFSLCCCCYHNHSAMSSFKCGALCSFPSICLRRWRAFPPYLVWAFFFFFLCLRMPVGLNCSNALSYELPALSVIYWICCPIYLNSNRSAGFIMPKGRIQENIGSNK